jgi:hypothetical protein
MRHLSYESSYGKGARASEMHSCGPTPAGFTVLLLHLGVGPSTCPTPSTLRRIAHALPHKVSCVRPPRPLESTLARRCRKPGAALALEPGKEVADFRVYNAGRGGWDAGVFQHYQQMRTHQVRATTSRRRGAGFTPQTICRGPARAVLLFVPFIRWHATNATRRPPMTLALRCLRAHKCIPTRTGRIAKLECMHTLVAQLTDVCPPTWHLAPRPHAFARWRAARADGGVRGPHGGQVVHVRQGGTHECVASRTLVPFVCVLAFTAFLSPVCCMCCT